MPMLGGHVMQLASAIGLAGHAIGRMIGEIELHHAAAQRGQPLAFAVCTTMPSRHRRGAGGRRAVAAFDLDQAKPAGAEGLQRVGGAELGNGDAGHRRGAHDRGALGHFDADVPSMVSVTVFPTAEAGVPKSFSKTMLIANAAYLRTKSCGK